MWGSDISLEFEYVTSDGFEQCLKFDVLMFKDKNWCSSSTAKSRTLSASIRYANYSTVWRTFSEHYIAIKYSVSSRNSMVFYNFENLGKGVWWKWFCKEFLMKYLIRIT